MATKRELILQTIKARLVTAGAATGCTGVYRTRADQYDRDEAPAITLGWVTDDADRMVVPYTERTLQVEVGVYTRGNEPDALADPIVQAIHAGLFADRTLGGLCVDITEAGDRLDVDAADSTAAMVIKQYAVWYRHIMEDMAQ